MAGSMGKTANSYSAHVIGHRPLVDPQRRNGLVPYFLALMNKMGLQTAANYVRASKRDACFPN
jgi:hypothetical protein